jgi:hypothetical protein
MMKEVITIYKKHQITVENFIGVLINSFKKDYIANSNEILKKYHFIQLIYSVDSNFKQSSPICCRRERDENQLGSDKSHYFMKLQLDENGLYISNPYIHYRTGKASISIVKRIENDYFVFDINLIELLEDLKLIEYNRTHDKVKRSIYFFGSSILALVSLALIGYGAYVFFKLMMYFHDTTFLHDIFNSIISVTLGLAMYDLAKQIFEHEVIFESFHRPEEKQYQVLGKFMISIIIALSIETLMVVFKIALDDYKNMSAAFYLLVGTTIMFVSLGYFYKTITESGCKTTE